MDPAKYVGRAPVQVEAYLNNVGNPMLEANMKTLVHMKSTCIKGYKEIAKKKVVSRVWREMPPSFPKYVLYNHIYKL